jgi:hypothetical protein|tara:strand:+ start:1225 stop:1962 length:738 start_codon:yes stop_codon:yes gene_type:complete
MALPRVMTPTYELELPSTGQKVTFRPFLVKEEKTLLMAMESPDSRAMAKAMRDILTSCTEGEIDLNSLAAFDIEYFFLQLRGRSVGEAITIHPLRPTNFKCCKEAGEEDICKVEINLEDIVMNTKSIQASEIKITDDIGMKMNFPSLDTVQKYATEGEDIKSENVFHLIVECIDYIWDGEDIFKAKDSTKKELNDFIESLSSGQFAKVRDFFESIPKLEHEIEWVCSKCKKSTSLVLQGIDAFFE